MPRMLKVFHKLDGELTETQEYAANLTIYVIINAVKTN